MLRKVWTVPLWIKLLIPASWLAFAIPFPTEVGRASGAAAGLITAALILGLLVVTPMAIGLHATGLHKKGRDRFGLGWGDLLIGSFVVGLLLGTLNALDAGGDVAFVGAFLVALTFALLALLYRALLRLRQSTPAN